MMNFDIALQREQIAQPQKKKAKRSLFPSAEKVYPIVAMENGAVVTKIGTQEYSYFLHKEARDLTNLSEKEYVDLTNRYWEFHKNYPHAFKEIYLSFNEVNKRQQEYTLYKLNKARGRQAIEGMREELEKLKGVEAHYTSYQSFMVLYGTSILELEEHYKHLLRAGNELFHFQKLSEKMTKDLIFTLNNTGG